MNIVVLGVNHTTAAVDVREKLAFRPERIAEAMRLLKNRDGVLECVILSTCNRVEIYSLLEDAEPSTLKLFLQEYHCIEGSIDDAVYVHKNQDALGHLCKVASGVDSLVVGEPQIFGQVKEAYNLALQSGTAGTVFKSLFPQAFTLVKVVRSRTGIGRANISVSNAAVGLAKRAFSDLSGKTVLIIGAGEIGELTVRSLVDSGVRKVFVCNRTFERAVQLAGLFKGTPLMFHEMGEYLPKADIIISSVDAPAYILNRTDFEKNRSDKPVVIVDLSVPRSIGPAVKELPGVQLFNIDDLKDAVQESLASRRKEAEKAVQLINSRVEGIWKKLDSADLAPVIRSLKETAERIWTESFCAYVKESGISGRDKEMVEMLTRSIVNRLVHNVITTVREYSNSIRYK